MMTEFVGDVKGGRHREGGWPNTCYGMSKLGVIAYTNVRTRFHRPGVMFVFNLSNGASRASPLPPPPLRLFPPRPVFFKPCLDV